MSEKLAGILKEKKDQILNEWEEEVKSILPPARNETKSSLRDSIPLFLNDLVIALKDGLNRVKPDIIRFAYKHGSERAYQSGYCLEDTLTEYNILRKIIFRILDKESPISNSERDIILESIDFGMKKAGAEYADQSAKELNILFELAGTGKAVVDPSNGQYLKVNQTFCDMIGYTENEILSMTLEDLTHPDDIPMQREFLKRTIEHRNEKLSITKRYVRKDGSNFWVEVFVSPLPGTPDHPYRNVSTFIDVTTKKLIETEQLEIKDRLKKITDIQPSLIGQVDKDLNYLFVNKTYEKWFHMPVQQIVGKNIRDIVGDVAYADLKPYFDRALNGEKVIFEKKITYKDNITRSSISTYSPSFDSKGNVNGVYVSVTDNTEQRKQLEELVNSEAIRDRFMSALSHDLRTPLTSAILSSQLIARKSTDTSVNTLSKKVEMSLKRVDKMIEDLLDANRLRAGQKISLKLQDIDMSELVKTTIADLETINGDRFVVDIPETFHTVLSPQGIRRIIENLCTNAIKYGSTSAPVSIFIHPHGDEFDLGVHNFGNPISKNESDSLFQPYVRAKKDEKGEKKGWGIGLSIVKGVTEAHGGKVVIDSDAEGTTFKITLPVDARPFAGDGLQLH